MPEEVPLGEDCKDWATKLDDKERNLLTQIFRFFTQSDVEVGANYMENYMPLFKAGRGAHDAGGVLQHGDCAHCCLRFVA